MQEFQDVLHWVSRIILVFILLHVIVITVYALVVKIPTFCKILTKTLLRKCII